MQIEERIQLWWEYVQLKLAEKFLSSRFIAINVRYQTSLRQLDLSRSVSRSQKHIRRNKSLFLASLMDEGLSWMLNPGQSPAGGGGFRGAWKGWTTRVPQFIKARTVWHRQGGLDRTVVKKPPEGINESEDLWPPPPPRERPRERESEKEILWCRGSILTVYFSISFSLLLSPFYSNNRTSYKATAARPTRPWAGSQRWHLRYVLAGIPAPGWNRHLDLSENVQHPERKQRTIL